MIFRTILVFSFLVFFIACNQEDSSIPSGLDSTKSAEDISQNVSDSANTIDEEVSSEPFTIVVENIVLKKIKHKSFWGRYFGERKVEPYVMAFVKDGSSEKKFAVHQVVKWDCFLSDEYKDLSNFNSVFISSIGEGMKKGQQFTSNEEMVIYESGSAKGDVEVQVFFVDSDYKSRKFGGDTFNFLSFMELPLPIGKGPVTFEGIIKFGLNKYFPGFSEESFSVGKSVMRKVSSRFENNCDDVLGHATFRYKVKDGRMELVEKTIEDTFSAEVQTY